MSQNEEPRQGSHLGWYLLGCIVVILVVAAACVLVGGLFLAFPFHESAPSSPPAPVATQVTGTVTP
jgi:hypothetical protein